MKMPIQPKSAAGEWGRVVFFQISVENVLQVSKDYKNC